ncbi:MAG: hypothetical protein ISS94_01455 [Candidatus Syntrophoarchaeum sp.]|nr:hypothetical protein [Methanomicrobia archaeon]MBL7117439.1 hypothetical protein [Candidatus Syntrophoarchaeum sp.]
MNKIEEVEIEDGRIKLPKEFIERFTPETKLIARIERFGLIITQKTDPVEDLIGCVKTPPINIEKQLDEREELG